MKNNSQKCKLFVIYMDTFFLNVVKFYHQISAMVHTATFFKGYTLVVIENKAVITLASFKTAFRASNRANEAGTRATTGVSTHLIVTVWRAGSS